jgi:hypothetical protein
VAAPFLALVERFVAAALRVVARVSALTVFVVSVASEAMVGVLSGAVVIRSKLVRSVPVEHLYVNPLRGTVTRTGVPAPASRMTR